MSRPMPTYWVTNRITIASVRALSDATSKETLQKEVVSLKEAFCERVQVTPGKVVRVLFTPDRISNEAYFLFIEELIVEGFEVVRHANTSGSIYCLDISWD